ncbi:MULTISPECIES: flagellar hook assembly protein FlgD [unclassified Sphingomonas]|uniref:flagellar hook assembly protein FlgD n=1 Tax=unclassified Sphingomonas TaxID=196159 RepID=UPI002151D26F|nr:MULTISPECIES: flagellar hook capping FlgD N-terminal domain-containing protein [unclassified Sphingomonas]MCR5870501.1 flagellar hook assembly protein FlgD [Sphingomonas sp. J344]UUY01152.1 flagellar hook assembly protein FlgD [Sphingomonas sp. J315]
MSFDTTMANLGIGRTGTAQANTNSLGTSAMDQSDFLTLMTAQMKNQDPFDPVDNTQMVAQMAQFSSLAGISEMNTTLQAIAAKLNATSTTDLVSWVGRTVLTEGAVAYPRTDGSLGGMIELGADAAEVNVVIEGPNGEILKNVSLGAAPSGRTEFEWDGTTDTGEPAGNGPFTLRVAARDADGDVVTAKPLVWAPVTAVAMGSDGNPVLTLPGIGQVSTTAIRQIG